MQLWPMTQRYTKTKQNKTIKKKNRVYTKYHCIAQQMGIKGYI